jgi:hypothetical protein
MTSPLDPRAPAQADPYPNLYDIRASGSGSQMGQALRGGFGSDEPYEPPLWAQSPIWDAEQIQDMRTQVQPAPQTTAEAGAAANDFPIRMTAPNPFGGEGAAPPLIEGLDPNIATLVGLQPGEQRGGYIDGPFGIPIATVPVSLANMESWTRERLAALLTYYALDGAYQRDMTDQFGTDTVYQGPEDRNFLQSVIFGYTEGRKVIGDQAWGIIELASREYRRQDALFRLRQVKGLLATGQAPLLAGTQGAVSAFTTFLLDPIKGEAARYSIDGIIKLANERGVDPISAIASLYDLPLEVVVALASQPNIDDTALESLSKGPDGNGLSFSQDAMTNLLVEGGVMIGMAVAGVVGAKSAVGFTSGLARGLAPSASRAFGAGYYGGALRGGGTVAQRAMRTAGWTTKKAIQFETLQTIGGWSTAGLEWGIKQAAVMLNHQELVALMDNLMYENPWAYNPGLNLMDAFSFQPVRAIKPLLGRGGADRMFHVGTPGTPGHIGSINISQGGWMRPATATGGLDTAALAAFKGGDSDIEVVIHGERVKLPKDHPQVVLIEKIRVMNEDDLLSTVLRETGWEKDWIVQTFGDGNPYGLTYAHLKGFVVYGYGQAVRALPGGGGVPFEYAVGSAREASNAYFRANTGEILRLFDEDVTGKANHLGEAIKGQWWELGAITDSKMAPVKARLYSQYSPAVAFENAKHWIIASETLNRALREGADVGAYVPGYSRTINRRYLKDFRAHIVRRFSDPDTIIPDEDVQRFRSRTGLVEAFDSRLKTDKAWTQQEFLELIDKIDAAGADPKNTRVVFTDGSDSGVAVRDVDLPTSELVWVDDAFPIHARALGIQIQHVIAIERVLAEGGTSTQQVPTSLKAALMDKNDVVFPKSFADLPPEEAWKVITEWYETALANAREFNFKVRVPLLEFRAMMDALLAEGMINEPVSYQAATAASRMAAEAMDRPKRGAGNDPTGAIDRHNNAIFALRDVAARLQTHLQSPLRGGRVVITTSDAVPNYVATPATAGLVQRLAQLAVHIKENPGNVLVVGATERALITDLNVHPLLKAQELLKLDWSTAPPEVQALTRGLSKELDGRQIAADIANELAPVAAAGADGVEEVLESVPARLAQLADEVDGYMRQTQELAGEVVDTQRWFDTVQGRHSAELIDLDERVAYAPNISLDDPLDNAILASRTAQGVRVGQVQRVVARQRAALTDVEGQLAQAEREAALQVLETGEYAWDTAVREGKPVRFRGSQAASRTALEPIAAQLHAETGLAYAIHEVRGAPPAPGRLGPLRYYELREGVPRIDRDAPLTGGEGEIESAMRAGDTERSQRLNDAAEALGQEANTSDAFAALQARIKELTRAADDAEADGQFGVADQYRKELQDLLRAEEGPAAGTKTFEQMMAEHKASPEYEAAVQAGEEGYEIVQRRMAAIEAQEPGTAIELDDGRWHYKPTADEAGPGGYGPSEREAIDNYRAWLADGMPEPNSMKFMGQPGMRKDYGTVKGAYAKTLVPDVRAMAQEGMSPEDFSAFITEMRKSGSIEPTDEAALRAIFYDWNKKVESPIPPDEVGTLGMDELMPPEQPPATPPRAFEPLDPSDSKLWEDMARDRPLATDIARRAADEGIDVTTLTDDELDAYIARYVDADQMSTSRDVFKNKVPPASQRRLVRHGYRLIAEPERGLADYAVFQYRDGTWAVKPEGLLLPITARSRAEAFVIHRVLKDNPGNFQAYYDARYGGEWDDLVADAARRLDPPEGGANALPPEEFQRIVNEYNMAIARVDEAAAAGPLLMATPEELAGQLRRILAGELGPTPNALESGRYIGLSAVMEDIAAGTYKGDAERQMGLARKAIEDVSAKPPIDPITGEPVTGLTPAHIKKVLVERLGKFRRDQARLRDWEREVKEGLLEDAPAPPDEALAASEARMTVSDIEPGTRNELGRPVRPEGELGKKGNQLRLPPDAPTITYTPDGDELVVGYTIASRTTESGYFELTIRIPKDLPTDPPSAFIEAVGWSDSPFFVTHVFKKGGLIEKLTDPWQIAYLKGLRKRYTAHKQAKPKGELSENWYARAPFAKEVRDIEVYYRDIEGIRYQSAFAAQVGERFARVVPDEPPAGEAFGRADPEPVRGGTTEFPDPFDETKNIPATFELRHIDELVTSADDGYDPSLQPRGRGVRETSEQQIEEIARTFIPERALRTESGVHGSALIDPTTNMTLTANGRTQAMRRMTQAQWDAYRAELMERAQEFGLDASQVGDHMVLVRTVGPEYVNAKYAKGFNPTGMSEAEQAVSISRLITPEDIGELNLGENVILREVLKDPKRQPFVLRILSELTPDERRQYSDAKGNLSDAGAKLVEQAILAKVLGDVRLVTRLIEGPEEGARFRKGLEMALGQLLKGEANAADPIAPLLADTYNQILDMVAAKLTHRDMEARFLMTGLDLGGPPKEVNELGLVLISLRSQAEIASFLRKYAEITSEPTLGFLDDAAPPLHARVNLAIDFIENTRKRDAELAGKGWSEKDGIARMTAEDGRVHTTTEEATGPSAHVEVTPDDPIIAETIDSAKRVFVDDIYEAGEGVNRVYRAETEYERTLIRQLENLDESRFHQQVRDIGMEMAGYRDDPEGLAQWLAEAVFIVNGGHTTYNRGVVYAVIRQLTGSNRWVGGKYDPVLAVNPKPGTHVDAIRRAAQQAEIEVKGQGTSARPEDVVVTGTKPRELAPDLEEVTGLRDAEPPKVADIAEAGEGGAPVVVGQADAAAQRAAQNAAHTGAGRRDRVVILHEVDATRRAQAIAARVDRLRAQRELLAQRLADTEARMRALPGSEGVEPGVVLPDDIDALYKRYVFDQLALGGIEASSPATMREVLDTIQSLDFEVPARPGQVLTPEELVRLREGLIKFADDKLRERGVGDLDDLFTHENLARLGIDVIDEAETAPAPWRPRRSCTTPCWPSSTAASLTASSPPTTPSTATPAWATSSRHPPTRDNARPTLYYTHELTEELAKYDRVVPGLGIELTEGRQATRATHVARAQDDEAGRRLSDNRILRILDTAFGPRPQKDIESQTIRRFAAEIGKGLSEEDQAKLGRGLISHLHHQMQQHKAGPLPFGVYRRIGHLRVDLLEQWAKDYMRKRKKYKPVYDQLLKESTTGTPIWDAYRKADNRIRAYFAQRPGGLADYVEAIYESSGVRRMAQPMAGLNVLYTLGRFFFDARWLAMDVIEAPILLLGREGPGAVWDMLKKGRGKADQTRLLFDMSGDTANQLMNRYAWWMEMGDAGGYFRWRNASLVTMVERGQARALVQELEHMARRDPVVAKMIADNGDNPMTYLRKLDRDWHIAASRDVELKPDEMRALLKDYVADGVVTPEELDAFVAAGRWVHHPELERAIAEASTPELRALFRRQEVITQQAWQDATNVVFGQADRSNFQRLLNSPLLYWPISYQIKATKWLYGMLFDRFMGYQTGGAPAAIFDMILKQHGDKLREDEDFQQFLKDNKNVLFMAQMLLPITPWDIGISLSPFTRLFVSMLMDEPQDAYQRNLFSVGPGYSYYSLFPRILQELDEGGTPVVSDVAERMRYMFPLNYNVPIKGSTGTRNRQDQVVPPQAWQPLEPQQPATRFGP